jgi:hypothetical protein
MPSVLSRLDSGAPANAQLEPSARSLSPRVSVAGDQRESSNANSFVHEHHNGSLFESTGKLVEVVENQASLLLRPSICEPTKQHDGRRCAGGPREERREIGIRGDYDGLRALGELQQGGITSEAPRPTLATWSAS